MENLPTSYAVGTTQAGPGTPSYSITSQPPGNHFTITNTGIIKTKKKWDYENPVERGPHTLTIKATRLDSSEDTSQIIVTLQNRLEPNETLTLPDDIPGITWNLVENTHFVMATGPNGRAPQYELNVQIKCNNNYYNGGNRYAPDLILWQTGTRIAYPNTPPSNGKPFPGTDNPLLIQEFWLAHDLRQPRPAGLERPGSKCQPDYTDIWNSSDTLYAMDANDRLIKAHNLEAGGRVITRNPAEDIPVSDDHYRAAWKILGIWADSNTVWVTSARTSIEEGRHTAAYSRTNHRRDTTKDYTASPQLTMSQDHSPGRTKNYLPTDKWFDGSNNLWLLHTQYRNAAGAVDPNEPAPSAFLTCTAPDNSTHELQINWNTDQARTPLRITGNKEADRLYLMDHGTQYLITFDTSHCPLQRVPSEYDHRDIPNRPSYPDRPSTPQPPTGMSTHHATPFMYYSFSTGEILYVSKIYPLITADTMEFPENTPPFTPIGKRFDPISSNIDNSPYSWTLSGPDANDFSYRTSGPKSQFFQLTTTGQTIYDYETKPAYELTLTVTDADGDTTTGDVATNLININEGGYTHVSITGDPYIGSTLTAQYLHPTDPDGLPPNPTPTYQWSKNGVPIPGETASTVALDSLDYYQSLITARLTFLDNGGFQNHYTTNSLTVTYPPVDVSFPTTSATVSEAESTTGITMTLSRTPHRDVIIPLVLTPGSQLTTSDYTLEPPTDVTFSPMQTSQTITFHAQHDHVDEDDEVLVITTGDLPTQVGQGPNNSLTIILTDDDTAGFSVSPTTLPANEDATTTYSIRLDSEPVHDVEITLTLPANPEFEASDTTLTFTPTNWNIDQTITITPQHDDDALHEDTVQILHTVSSSDTKYSPLIPHPIFLTVSDADEAGYTISDTNLTIEEGERDSYTIRLDTEPSAPVTITINNPSNRDITAVPASITFTSQDWNTPQTVTVNTVDDDDAPDDQDVITHTVNTDAIEYQTNTAP